ncbi:MAG TPA: hypothetical protein VKP30_13950 [Polyangiaceae bacterium]|nr:hypothetical protein [Polyangiaceae bacterium]
MSTLFRSVWFAIATVLYVAFAALQAYPSGLFAWCVAILGPIVLWLTWRYTGNRFRLNERDPDTVRDAIRATTAAAMLFLSARAGPLGHPGFVAAANLSVGIALVTAIVSIGKIPSRGGLLSAPNATRSLDAAIFAAVLWGIATTLPAMRTLLASTVLVLDPIAIDYTTITAGMASLLLMLAVTFRLFLFRRLEVDVADRAISALTVASVALLATLPALLLDVIAPDRAVPTVVIVSSLFHVWAASASDARRITTSLRAVLAILTFLSPVVLGLALLSRTSPELAPHFIVFTAALSIVLGMLATRLSRPLGPEQSRWLDAIHRASEAALVPDPEDALRATLAALAPIAPGPSSRVELWRLQPDSVLYVDIAGQLHDEPAIFPTSPIELAAEEPERTLRLDVLQSVQVRNTKARDALSYLQTRHVCAATLLTSESGPLGLLTMPTGSRRSPLSLEEASALRGLADRLESVLAITAAQARSRQRELETVAKLNALTDETKRLTSALESDGARQKRFAERYAKHLRPTIYSPNARAAQIEIERLAKLERALALVLPPGADALGWASLAHLASQRQTGPFVVFDATTADFNREIWDDPAQSPLSVAETGTWVLINPQVLESTQLDVLVSTLSQHLSHANVGSSLGAGVVLAWHRGTPQSTADPLPREDLLKLFPEQSRVQIPSLSERAEDLRALVYERAARLGAIVHGMPLGVDMPTLAALLEHDWPLNDLELDMTMYALVLATQGAVIDSRALDRIAFGNAQPRPDEAPLQPAKRRTRVVSPSIRPRDR